MILAGTYYQQFHKHISSIYDTQEKIRYPEAWAFQKESELLPIFNYGLQKMQQTGVMDRLRLKYLGDHSSHTGTAMTQDSIGLGYENVAFPFMALLGGLCLAFIQIGIEITFMCMKKCSFDEEQSEEDGSPSEEANDAIDEIYDLLRENHCKAEDLKFLSKMRELSRKHL